MFIVMAAKIGVFAALMIVVGCAALATGNVFGNFLVAMSRNPAERDGLFSNAMIGFVLIESFVFTAAIICVIVYIAL
jgi:F0F1-type ATP synthase membrane subunit c/vacuolar-type H+-ATPase subunit K